MIPLRASFAGICFGFAVSVATCAFIHALPNLLLSGVSPVGPLSVVPWYAILLLSSAASYFLVLVVILLTACILSSLTRSVNLRTTLALSASSMLYCAPLSIAPAVGTALGLLISFFVVGRLYLSATSNVLSKCAIVAIVIAVATVCSWRYRAFMPLESAAMINTRIAQAALPDLDTTPATVVLTCGRYAA
jgi:hypothetical protein